MGTNISKGRTNACRMRFCHESLLERLCSQFQRCTHNILLRFNKTEKRAIGLTLMDFSVLIQLTNLGPRSFPLTGLNDLEPEWQETVLEIIQNPPVNQILKVLAYTPTLAETMPITFVEKPPMPIAA